MYERKVDVDMLTKIVIFSENVQVRMCEFACACELYLHF